MATLAAWNQIEWAIAIDSLDANGVDTNRMLEAWGTSTNPTEHDGDFDDDAVILTADRNAWVVGVLGGDDAFDPAAIPGLTWCVCGRESDSDPWEPCEYGLPTEEAAMAWLRENYRDTCAGMTDFYIDLESHDEPADLWATVCEDGSLRFETADGKSVEA